METQVHLTVTSINHLFSSFFSSWAGVPEECHTYPVAVGVGVLWGVNLCFVLSLPFAPSSVTEVQSRKVSWRRPHEYQVCVL